MTPDEERAWCRSVLAKLAGFTVYRNGLVAVRTFVVLTAGRLA